MRSITINRRCCICVIFAIVALARQSNAFSPPASTLSKIATVAPRGGETLTSSLNLIAAPAAVAASISLPTAKMILATNLLPTCIGFYKYEYGVSYAYGTATATTAYLVLRSLLSLPTPSPFVTMAKVHAAAIVFYGVRLNLFLLYREVFIPRFRMMRQKIEARQTKKEVGTGIMGRLMKRTPFILSCAVLYAGLSCPALISGKLIQMSNDATAASAVAAVATSSVRARTRSAAAKSVATAAAKAAAASSTTSGILSNLSSTCVALTAYKILVGMTWFGFALGALGDFTKTFVKARCGEDHLVTSGIFSFLRHPNYTGEVIAWTASFLASIAAIFCVSGLKLQLVLKSLALPMLLSFSGAIGIIFVLCAATTNLERRQKKKYGETPAYNNWLLNSWPGFKLPPKK